MHSLIKLCLLAITLNLVASRLILPSMLHHIKEQTDKTLRPELRDKSKAVSAESTAAPVGGLQNATSGYLSVNDPNGPSKLFYVFYSCKGLKPGQTAKDVPIIIWLQGGPGASSFMGAFMEIGPYHLAVDATTGEYVEVANPKSWNDYYNLLIVDNPRGTGYSYAANNSYVTDQDEVAADFLNALLNFYKLSPFTVFDRTPLYVFGESYGGHYVPSITKKIQEYNAGTPAFSIPLAGMGVGDGWTDPIHQLANYGMFGFSMGFLDYVEREGVEKNILLGIGNILNEDFSDALNNFDNICDAIQTGGGGVNIYNYRSFGNYDTSFLGKFFNNPKVAARYNVDPSLVGTYHDQSDAVYNALTNDFMKSVADRVAVVLDSNLPVLLYNGQFDIIVNTPTAINWIGQLPWSGQTGFYNTPLQNWILNNGTVAGLAKNYGNFTFVIVNKAGHMGPMDQLDLTIEMVNRFTHGFNQWNTTF